MGKYVESVFQQTLNLFLDRLGRCRCLHESSTRRVERGCGTVTLHTGRRQLDVCAAAIGALDFEGVAARDEGIPDHVVAVACMWQVTHKLVMAVRWAELGMFWP